MMMMVFCVLQKTNAQAPSADFTASVTSGCSPLLVNFQDLSTGAVAAYSWDFGNGGTSTLKNPSAIYFAPGTYTVTLTVTDAANQSSTKTKTAFVTVYNPPTVDFVSDRKTGCSPATIKFTDKSVTPAGTLITSWKWDFGDGGSSTAQNPSYSYRNPGQYTVTLSITNDKGCTQLITKPNYIDVTPGIVATFSYADPDVCSAPATVNFTNTSSGPGTLTYLWNFGNGSTATTQHASTVFQKNGSYRLSLIVSSNMGCTDSSVSNIDIGKVTTDFIIPSTICPKTQVQFLNNGNPRPISSNWKFSNGTTDTLKNGLTSFATPGNYTVTLINRYAACIDTLVKNITVANGPDINFSASDTGKCQPTLLVNFTNSSTASTYYWDFGDSTTSTQAAPTHSYVKAGDFNVTLIGTAANGCKDTLQKPAYIKIRKPVIKFPDFPVKGCIPFTTNFIADVQSVDEITGYKWDFGDGQSANTKQPSHTYPIQGSYNVTLTVTTKGGCTEIYTLPNAVTVGSKPTAAFSAATFNECADPGVQFNNLSTGATSYIWSFSDGSSTTEPSPRHVFTDTGWIDVSLMALNSGCQDVKIEQRYVYIKPTIAKFDYKPDCNNNLQYSFTDKSIIANTWNWDFGDGTTYSGQTPPVHTFPSAGVYDVKLTAGNGSCSYTVTRSIEIRDLTPDFTSNSHEGCKPFTTTIFPVIKDGKLITNYVWNFGDGSGPIDFGQGSYGQHSYTKAGNYDITLNTIDTFGCSHVITKNAFVKIYGPKADFTSLNSAGCKGLVANFIDSSRSDGIHPITSWKWDFGDSTIQSYTAGPFRHMYDSVGDYDVKLVVRDNIGCSDSITYREFIKISTLKAGFQTAGQTCPDAYLGFFNQTTSDLPYTSLWYFGDGDTSTAKELSHMYADTGRYTVSLVVQDILGCRDSLAKKDAVIVGLPKASFTANNFATFCTPFQAKFQNTSSYYQISNWDLGQATSNQNDPQLYYTNPGTYPIKLVVTSPGGCKDSVQQTLQVYDASQAKIAYDPLVGCRPLTVNLEAFTKMNGRFIWDFGDGNVIDTTLNTFTHVYDNPGTFIPKIVLKEPEGCLVPLQGQEEIKVNGAKAKFGINRRLFCDSGYIAILDSTITVARDPISTYTWDFGDGSISNNKIPVHQYTSPGNYTVSLVVETQFGCKDTAVYTPPVKVVQSPLIAIGGDTVICVNQQMTHLGIFLRQDTSAVRWDWQLANNKSSGLQNPLPQNYLAGNYTIQTIALNSSGCADTVLQKIVVNPLPVITMPASLTKIVGVPILLPATYSSNVTGYTWLPATNLDCSDCPQPVTTTKFDRKYIVSVIDSNGCVNSSTVQVIVLCTGAEIFVPNTFSPNADGSNDRFYPRGKGFERIRSFRVFNRWGEVVFENREFPINDAAAGWDGRYKGGKPQPGVYVYQIEMICENGEIIKFNGNVALIQ